MIRSVSTLSPTTWAAPVYSRGAAVLGLLEGLMAWLPRALASASRRSRRAPGRYGPGVAEDLGRIHDMPGHGGGRHHGGRAQVDVRVGVAHAAAEVAVGAGDDRLVVAGHALVGADAGSAAAGDEAGAGVREGL